MNRVILLLACAGLIAAAAGAANATVYTSDKNLADFETKTYGTFSNYAGGGMTGFVPYTPTNANLAVATRVFGGKKPVTGLSTTNNWILVTFTDPTASIRIFPMMDHFGSATDGYQYAIEGSNDGTSWTALFDADSVVGTKEPFTLGTFTGTAPTSVNNVLSLPKTSHIGYIADFTFDTAYKYYALGASTQAFLYGDGPEPPSRALKPEFEAVASLATTPGASHVVPEPAGWAMMLTGIGAMGFVTRRRRAVAAA
jgi:hypothetical protein